MRATVDRDLVSPLDEADRELLHQGLVAAIGGRDAAASEKRDAQRSHGIEELMDSGSHGGDLPGRGPASTVSQMAILQGQPPGEKPAGDGPPRARATLLDASSSLTNLLPMAPQPAIGGE